MRIQTIEENDSEEIYILSSSKRNPQQRRNGWEECNLNSTKIANVKFLGIRRINLRVQQQAQYKGVFRYFFFDKLINGIIKQLSDRIVVSSVDLLQYIGVKIMMGFMRLSDINQYWSLEPILATQIRTVFEQKYFIEIDQQIEINQQTLCNEMVSVKQEDEQFVKLQTNFDEFLPLQSKKLNKKFRQALLPSQELVLIKNQTLQGITNKIELYQLIEKDSFYVLQQFFWCVKDNNRQGLQNKIIQFLEPYVGLHHIIYTAPRLLDHNTVMTFYQKRILICTEVIWTLQEFQQKQVLRNGMVFAMRQANNNSGLLFPSFQALQSLQGILTAVGRHQLSCEKVYILGTQDGSQIQTLLPFIIETIINNTFSIIGNNKSLKQQRIQLAQELLKNPILPISQSIEIVDIPPLKSQINVSTQTTETLRLPLEKVLHCPLFDGNARCLVCLYEGNLAKTQASCLGCSDTLQRKIYLCVYPCFRKFHLNPLLYIGQEESIQIEGYYDDFQLEDEQEQVPAQKPENNSNLDQIYTTQHRDLEEEFQQQQYGVPMNYEDDFRNKTKWVKVTKPRGGTRNQGRARSKQTKQVAFNLPDQGLQGGSDSFRNSEPKKKGSSRAKGTRSKQQQQQNQQQNNSKLQSVMRQDRQDDGQSAMLDFFQMVRKKVNSGNQ